MADSPLRSDPNNLYPTDSTIDMTTASSVTTASTSRPLPRPRSPWAEQAFSRELLLTLTRDTALAAVPWLRSSAKARH
jgi:hypothetical protein